TGTRGVPALAARAGTIDAFDRRVHERAAGQLPASERLARDRAGPRDGTRAAADGDATGHGQPVPPSLTSNAKSGPPASWGANSGVGGEASGPKERRPPSTVSALLSQPTVDEDFRGR